MLSVCNRGLNEYKALRKDGSVLPCLIHSSAIRRGGEIVGIRGGLTNISKIKIMEADLKESEARYRHLIQSTPAGIFEVDFKKMRYISVNDIMCKYTGYTREELLNIDPSALLTEDNKQGFKRFVEDAYAGKPIPAPVEYKVKGKNGREIWVVITNRFFYENGVPVRAMSVAHDVTDLRKVEEEKKCWRPSFTRPRNWNPWELWPVASPMISTICSWASRETPP
ncbi:MAG: PAS domain-containing protein [Desulfosalsimonadaceae bacterium]